MFSLSLVISIAFLDCSTGVCCVGDLLVSCMSAGICERSLTDTPSQTIVASRA